LLSLDKLKFVEQKRAAISSTATHVLMSTAVWQLPATGWGHALSGF